MAVLETYVIGDAQIASLISPKLDSGTVTGITLSSSIDVQHSVELDRVATFAVVNAVELYEALDADSIIGHGTISFVETLLVGVGEIVVGTAVISAIHANGIIHVGTVIGRANIYQGPQIETPTVVGLGDLNWPATGGKDRFAAVDSSVINMSGTIITTFENATYELSSDIYPHANSGGNYGDEFVLDEAPLDDVLLTLDEKYLLELDTPDAATVTGTAMLFSGYTESGTVESASAIAFDFSIGFAATYTVSGSAQTSSEDLFPTYGEVNGIADIGQAVSAFVLNTTEFAIADDEAFRYSISAIDSYTYVPALAGAANGITSLSVNAELQIAIQNVPNPLGPTGPTTGAIAGKSTLEVPIGKSTSRYAYAYPSGPAFPGSPSTGDLFYHTLAPTGPAYYVYDGAGWSITNRPPGYYGPTGPSGPGSAGEYS